MRALYLLLVVQAVIAVCVIATMWPGQAPRWLILSVVPILFALPAAMWLTVV